MSEINHKLLQILYFGAINMAVLQSGTVVRFSVSQGSIVYNYTGVITRWNGASYDIQVGSKTYYNIPENAIVVSG
ncbi:MAG: hypothetical protein AAF378_04480 [Cyanobacteria bacterium P01_A01_bin.84]